MLSAGFIQSTIYKLSTRNKIQQLEETSQWQGGVKCPDVRWKYCHYPEAVNRSTFLFHNDLILLID